MTVHGDCVNWDEWWRNGKTPWDIGKPTPALEKLITNADTKNLLPICGRGLVPGCSGGYDVRLLATKDRRITGLDLSATAIAMCNKNHPDAHANNYELVVDDFYTFQVPTGGYDFAYDYRFLCAMPPRLHPQWAARYAQIIKKDGILICLMFPLDEREGGPPFPVSEQLYADLLSTNFDLVYLADADGLESKKGKQKLSVWKRRD